MNGENGQNSSTQPFVLEGGSTGGGGGFVHKNSKILFELVKEAAILLLKNADRESFKPIGEAWNKEQIIEIFENLIMADKQSLTRNGTDNLFYDYGYDEKTGKPWLKVLKPFFDFHSSVAVIGPKDAYFYRIQTQIIIELFHELSHLVLNHPKGEVSTDEVKKIEAEASTFANDFFLALVSEAIVCAADFSPEMFSLKTQTEDSDKNSEEPSEYLVWTFLKYGNRGVVMKTTDVSETFANLDRLYEQPVTVENLVYSKNTYSNPEFTNGSIFPPAPDFDQFFTPLTEVEKIWHSVFYSFSINREHININIRKYVKGFATGMNDQNGGLISRLEALEDALWNSLVKFDLSKSRHSVKINRQNLSVATYDFFNIPKDIMEDKRVSNDNKQEKVIDEERAVLQKIEVECRAIRRQFTISDSWPHR